MNVGNGEPWRGPPASQGPPASNFPPAPQQHPNVLPPPPPYQHSSQPSGSHNLSIADLTQNPSSQYNTQPPPAQLHSLPGMAQHGLPHQSPPYISRERELREIREREMREQEMREQRNREMQQRHQEDLRERDQMLQREQQYQAHAGSTPLHQPVPSNPRLHGPNGLLANGGAGPSQSAAPPFNMHGQLGEPQRQPPFAQQQVGPPQAPAMQPMFGGPSPMQGQAQLAHGQQPILNDALSYLDQVKVRFSDHPDVYNRFLDIMKDFKSQAIDTPGVIERVSNLFNGHPALIQGFNTFLPPGYRIECGTDDNPDAIRVTTPSGRMTQSLQSGVTRAQIEGIGPASTSIGHVNNFDGRMGWNRTIGQDGSPRGRPAVMSAYDQATLDRDIESGIHQQEQRGVSSLQNAVSAATNGVSRAAMASPTPQGAFGPAGGLFSQAGDPKRGPVEFNHAISYVNKIKNRFAQQPEIYKQFLEILQTYQRESKPIQDVYSQVTQLFNAAPDLLEDFKQFLPETAANARAQASARAAAADELLLPTSDLRGASGYNERITQAQTPRPAGKMPPMGQFDPPSTSKENKKRRAPGLAGGAPIPQPALGDGLTGGRAPAVQVGNAAKRQKITSQRHIVTDGPVSSPTLIPQLPEPLPPLPPLHTTVEELAFFDRAKKHIANRSTFTEFLKLVNLFTQDLIDKHVLIDRAGTFLGSSPDLMAFFTNFLGVEEDEEIAEARIRPDPGRVNLAHCRSLGPSYRHLPKRDQNKACKGRDGMCYEVLNDQWASHPTWASEDSGFVAHRKNQYEEALHRVEEERHDYDFHIESCQRTIQLMEPLVQQINAASEADRVNFQLQPGLGGASEAIPKRIIMKVWGRETGAKVLADMFSRPAAVLPLVLRRVKQKLEEWKQTQREWEKVWREQINKQFWRSLDHQGINVKNTDKKAILQKTLISEIQAKWEEQRKKRDAGFSQLKHQLEYTFSSPDVILDATRLVLVGLEADRHNYNTSDQTKIRNFFLDFIPKFFSMEKQQFDNLVLDSPEVVRLNDEVEEDRPNGARPRARSKSKLKKQALLYRNVLDRSRDDSVVSASKESTPMPVDASDNETPIEAMSDGPSLDKPPSTWLKINPRQNRSVKVFTIDETYPHTTFNFWANANPYHFFRLFEMLYSRLLAVKVNEPEVHEAISRYKSEGREGNKTALSLGMVDRTPEDHFHNTGPGADYYGQILQMCEEVIVGQLEMNQVEETLRRYYNGTGWQLYSVDKLVVAIIRCIWSILSSDNKDKSLDITNLFLKDRDRPDTTRAQEIQYRKQVEKFSKDGEVYRISFTPVDGKCTIRFFPPEDSTFDNDAMSDEARWNYYLSSYAMTYATEGVDQSRMQYPFIRRSMPAPNANVETAYEEVYGSLYHQDGQTASISPDTYKIRMEGELAFYRFVTSKKKYTPGKIEENERFLEKFVRNVAWMKDQRAEHVERRKAVWEHGVKDGMDGFETKVQETTGVRGPDLSVST